jgi:RNA polymerase sigma-70 factor (ECF subfamily)
MTDPTLSSAIMQQMLSPAALGDEVALDALLRHYRDRLTILTRRMLGDFARVKRWAETDDVMQNAMIRLLKALREVKPQTHRDFLALANLQIRRELLDLARHFYGPHGVGANHDSQMRDGSAPAGHADQSDVRYEPSSLAQWTELHEQIAILPAEERDVVECLFYQGLSQAQAAEVLNISLRTVQRRWHDALCKLYRVWNQ